MREPVSADFMPTLVRVYYSPQNTEQHVIDTQTDQRCRQLKAHVGTDGDMLNKVIHLDIRTVWYSRFNVPLDIL